MPKNLVNGKLKTIMLIQFLILLFRQIKILAWKPVFTLFELQNILNWQNYVLCLIEMYELCKYWCDISYTSILTMTIFPV